MSDLKISIIPNGPYKCEGDVSVFDPQGNAVETREGKAVFLCRCGASSNKPFCDGTHKGIDFTPDQAGPA